MKLQFAFLLLISTALLTASSCKEECHDPANPDCENYDPCYGKTPFEADFIMEEVIRVGSGGAFPGQLDTSYVSDTIVSSPNSGVSARFTAAGNYNTYHWQIGTDPTVFTTKSFKQFFPNPVTVWVTLIATRTPDTLCFPNDDGIDTVKKRLVVVPRSQSLIFGNYMGASTQKPDSNYAVRFEICPSNNQNYRLTGLAACNLTFACNNSTYIGYRGGFFNNFENDICNQYGFIYYDKPSNKVTIKYQQAVINIGQINYYNGTKQ